MRYRAGARHRLPHLSVIMSKGLMLATAAIDKVSFLAALRRILPAEAVIAEVEALRVYECDALSAYRELPMAVVVPERVEEVQAVLRLCRAHGVPVVARGAGTGLSGGALPHCRGIVLGLARFNRILSIDADNRTATVEPGVRNLAVSEAAARYGLYYAPNPSSQIACTVGGNVAENAGGVHCLKYGLTVHNVLSVTFLTLDGELCETGGPTLDAPGYDLLALLSGSEGLLGIITSITVKLLPRPAGTQVLLAAFERVEDAGRGVAAVIAAGIIPAGLEMMDALAIRAAEDYAHAGYPLDAAAILLCELDGYPEEIAEQLDRVQGILRRRGRRGAGGKRRGRTAALLGRSQGGLPRGRAHRAGLLLYGRDHPAPGVGPGPHAGSPRCRKSTASGSPTCSMPATGTSIRSSSTTRIAPTSCSAPRPWVARCWSYALRSGARSRASTGWASRSSRRCASNSAPRSWPCFTRSSGPSTRTAC